MSFSFKKMFKSNIAPGVIGMVVKDECPKCSAEVGNDDKFCAECGHEIKANKEVNWFTGK